MSGVEAVFGVVTGGAGLISLGFQLSDSAKRLKKMYNKAKDAPKSLEILSFELETMAMSLQLLDQQRQRLGPNSAEIVFARCLAISHERTREIQQIVDSMTLHLENHARLRGKLYFAFKDKDVEELLNRLEKVKSSLQMAYAMYQNELTHNILARHGNLLHGIQTRLLAEVIDGSSHPTSLVPNSTQTPTSTAATDKTLAKRRVRRVDAPYQFRLRLPYWRRMWDIAITLTASSLGLELRTYNIVPDRSAIFHYCERGDLASMQDLLRGGRAGLLDVRKGRLRCIWMRDEPYYENLLSCAAGAGHLHICRYILSQTTWTDRPEVLSYALARSRWNDISLLKQANSEGYEWYGTFLDTPGFDGHPLDDTFGCYWLDQCYDFECFNLIYQKSCLDTCPAGSTALQTRFDMAIQIGWESRNFKSMDFYDFIRCLGLHVSDPRLATLRSTGEGRSALHYVARRLDIRTVRRGEDRHWADFGVELLKSGADAFSLSRPDYRCNHDQHRTPLMEYLSYDPHILDISEWHLRYPLDRIPVWADMFRRAGIDLDQYGATEAKVWDSLRETQPMPRYLDNPTFSRIVYGPRPADWSLMVQNNLTVCHSFVLQNLPGAFPRDQRVPRKICWQPSAREEVEGSWGKTESFSISSPEIRIEDAIFMYKQEHEEEPFIEMANDTQDDAGVVALMLLRGSRRRVSASRSHSQPPPMFRRKRAHNSVGRPIGTRWLPAYHLCLTDSRWHIPWNAGYDESELATSHCFQATAKQPTIAQESWGWQLRSFLAEIKRCQEGRWCSRGHTSFADCPWNCAAVKLDKLQVPADLKPYHPKRRDIIF